MRHPHFQKTPHITERIFAAIEDETGITRDMIRTSNRKREIVTARHIAATLLYAMTRNSLETVGLLINRDHSSVVHSRKTLLGYIDTEDSTVELVWNVVERINIDWR